MYGSSGTSTAPIKPHFRMKQISNHRPRSTDIDRHKPQSMPDNRNGQPRIRMTRSEQEMARAVLVET